MLGHVFSFYVQFCSVLYSTVIISIASEGAGRFVGRHLSVRSRFLVLCSVLFCSVLYTTMITSIASEGAGRFAGRHLSVRSRFLV